MKGLVVSVGGQDLDSEPTRTPGRRRSALDQGELERRLLEMGFVEGAMIEILHEGMIGRDPIGVRLDDMLVALRRREADAVMVRLGQAVDLDGTTDLDTVYLQAAE